MQFILCCMPLKMNKLKEIKDLIADIKDCVDGNGVPNIQYISNRIDDLEKVVNTINYIPCCETLKDEGQATLTEYATEIINMQENPQDSNKDWKIVVIKNTIGKLYQTLQAL